MKTAKIINNVINGIYKKRNPGNWKIQEDGELTYITDGFVMYVMEDCPLKVNSKLREHTSLKNLIDVKEDDLKIVGKLLYQKPFGKDIISFYQIDDKKIVINEKLLKNFDNPVLKSYGNPLKPAYVYENNKLVGLVCPIRYEED